MYEKYMICTRDFCNVGREGSIAGFQLRIRINYYRGCYLSMIDTLRLVVDGQEFSPGDMTFSLAGRTWTFAELSKETTARWPFGEPALLTVRKPGGLTSGRHKIELGLFIRNSYVPRFDREGLYAFPGLPRTPDGATHWGEPPSPLPLTASKTITLVQ